MNDFIKRDSVAPLIPAIKEVIAKEIRNES